MFPSHKRALPLLLSLLLLLGCGNGPPTLVRQIVPISLLECPPEPPPPSVQSDDQELALWLVDLATAGADCRDRLARVKELLHD